MLLHRITLLFTGIACLAATSLFAQRNLTLYQLNAVPQSSLLNPGRMPLSNGYVGLPVIGSLNAGYSNNGFTINDLGLNGDEETDFLNNDFEELLNRLGVDNTLQTDLNIGWIDFGFRVQKNFFSFQINDFLQMRANYPKALFELLDDAQTEDGEVQNTRTYLLDQLGINGTHFRTYSAGYTRVITSKLSAGVRLKYLSGLANVTTINSGLEVMNDSDSDYFNIQGRLDVFSSGLQTLQNDPGGYFGGTGNRGFAFDLGANYQVTDQIEVFASMVNVGSIRWKNDLTMNSFIADNIELSDDNIEEFEEAIDEFIDSLQAPGQNNLGYYKTKLPAMAYLGGNYFFRPNTSVGLIVNPRFYDGDTDLAFSVGLQHRVNRWFQAVVNYSSYDKTGSNLGAGLALNLGPLQFYFASDNILPVFNINDAKNLQFNTGLNLAFGRVTRTQQLAGWQGENPEALTVEAITEVEIENEKPSKPVEKPTREAKPKRTKEAPLVTTPAPVIEEMKPYLTITGSASNNNTGALLEGIAVDVYRELPDGKEEAVLFKSFLNGQISFSLLRTQTYRVVVKKPGFINEEIRVIPAEMEGINTLEKRFMLSVAPPPTLVEKPTTPKPQPKVEKPEETKPAVSPTKPTETYSLIEATSFREGASHETRAILRFPVGAKVVVVDKTNDLWWRVRYLGRVGYAKAALLAPVQ